MLVEQLAMLVEQLAILVEQLAMLVKQLAIGCSSWLCWCSSWLCCWSSWLFWWSRWLCWWSSWLFWCSSWQQAAMLVEQLALLVAHAMGSFSPSPLDLPFSLWSSDTWRVCSAWMKDVTRLSSVRTSLTRIIARSWCLRRVTTSWFLLSPSTQKTNPSSQSALKCPLVWGMFWKSLNQLTQLISSLE